MMAKQHTAVNRVEELESQASALQTELARLAGLRLDPVKDLDAAAAREGRKLAVTAALAQIAEELEAARQAAALERDAAREEAKAVEREAALSDAAAALAALLDALPKIDALITKINAAHGRLLAAGGYRRMEFDAAGGLAVALGAMRTAVAQTDAGRKALHLPPKRTQHETFVIEARSNLARASERLALAQALTGDASGRNDAIERALNGVHLARVRLAELGEGAAPSARELAVAVQQEIRYGPTITRNAPAPADAGRVPMV